jgi:hypothetical protein
MIPGISKQNKKYLKSTPNYTDTDSDEKIKSIPNYTDPDSDGEIKSNDSLLWFSDEKIQDVLVDDKDNKTKKNDSLASTLANCESLEELSNIIYELINDDFIKKNHCILNIIRIWRFLRKRKLK